MGAVAARLAFLRLLLLLLVLAPLGGTGVEPLLALAVARLGLLGGFTGVLVRARCHTAVTFSTQLGVLVI